MKHITYFEKAALLREIAIQDNATLTAKDVLKLYDEALDDINNEIAAIKVNFQRRYGLDNETASYFLTQAQQEEKLNALIYALENAPDEKQRKNILEFIHCDGLSVRAYASRIERYDAVKQSIYARIKKLAAEQIKRMTGMLKEAYSESYYGNIDDTAKGLDAGISFSVLNDRAIEEAVGAKWHGRRFSERVWENTDRLAEETQGLIIKSLMSGESLTKTAKKLKDSFNVSKYRTTTLIHTETAHIHAMADMKAYEDLGVTEYKYLATLDYATCDMCQPLDGRVFRLSEAREGVNYPTMHPRCRCTTTINIDFNSRRARNPLTGKNEIIDGSVTYDEWINSLSPEQTTALGVSRKKDANRTKDKLQFAEYKKRLGTKAVGRSFDKFQDIKYNNRERWNKLMRNYKLFSKIDSTDSYSPEYKEKLKNTYSYFKDNGYEFTEHALGRVVGQKQGKGKRSFTKEELLSVLKKEPNYEQDDNKVVRFYNRLSVIQAKDTGEVVSVVARDKARSDWKEVK